MSAFTYIQSVVKQHGDGPIRVFAHTGGNLALAWDIAGEEWSALIQGGRVRVRPPHADHEIVTTIDGDKTFEALVMDQVSSLRLLP